MPEIPEMETYKIQLQRRILGKVMTSVQINREKSVNLQVEPFTNQLISRSVTGITRYGKALFFHLSSGHLLFLHLMLGGKLFWGSEDEAPDRTKQVILSFGIERLFFIGLRLGHLHLISEQEYQNHIRDMGPDALSGNFDTEWFLKRLKSKRSPVKVALTDQKFLAGIGNRYSDEICFAAKCDPRKKAYVLTNQEGEQLLLSMRQVLKEAIQAGGYMDTPLYKGDQQTGGYIKLMKVHRREGEPCPRCGTPIKMVEVSSKKTYFCPRCQQ